MYRTNTCGELRIENVGQTVTLAGWVQGIHNLGGLTFIDLRDRYGITQLAFNEDCPAALKEQAGRLGREYVVQAVGTVAERYSKNAKLPTGDIEIIVSELNIISESATPPFTIEDNTDGGDELRMKYRYLDLRRPMVRKNLELRHKMTILIRNFLDSRQFIEVETPILIGSTPEGARDFVVPSRMNPGQFYALPQSPQTLKQLLMVSGFDRYFQIAKCFRDEDLRADRQPEFTQIDCEMSFVDQEDVIDIFEEMARHLFREIRGVELPAKLRQMTWHEAMAKYGSDKPDLRFGMEFVELDDVLKLGTFQVFDNAAYIGGICAPGCASYTRKQLDQLTDFVKSQQVGAKGLVYIKVNEDGTIKSSVDKFYTPEQLQAVADKMEAKKGDLFSPATTPTRHAYSSAPCVWRWAVSWGSWTRISSSVCGLSISHCSSGATKSSASCPPTIRSQCQTLTTYHFSIATLRRYAPRLTTLSATASRSVVAHCVFMMANCRQRCSRFWASHPKGLWHSSASSSMPSSTEHRHMQVWPSVSTASSASWQASTAYATA